MFETYSDKYAQIASKKEESASQVAEFKENLIANIAHDLKSPISSQIQAIKILLSHNTNDYDDFQNEILNQLLSSNYYMQDLIENLLLKFKSQNSKFELMKKKNNLAKSIDKAISTIIFMFNEKGQSISLQAGNKNIVAVYDDIEIQRVIQNLLTNASKYGDANSEIKVVIKKKGEYASISVINSGKKLSSNTKEIFNIYNSNSKQHKTVGVGLGLHVSREIIEAHNGMIKARNMCNNVVVFNFKIPING